MLRFDISHNSLFDVIETIVTDSNNIKIINKKLLFKEFLFQLKKKYFINLTLLKKIIYIPERIRNLLWPNE